jgi:hypothetical protein
LNAFWSYLWSAFSLTLTIFLTLFLPIIICCIILNLLAGEQSKRWYMIGGWNGLLLISWLGTPIHELSHAVAAMIGGHQIQSMQLFKPDKRTGSLGYVVHTYDSDNLYQSVIGNSIIAIAPFFGGATAIYLILKLILPEFSLFAPEVPRIHQIISGELLNPRSYLLMGESIMAFLQHLFNALVSLNMLSDWRFYLAFFILWGIAVHLSPSASDFRNFWQPMVFLIVFMTILNLIILPLTQNSMDLVNSASGYIYLVMPILLLAIFISALGLIITLIIYAFISLISS